MRTPIHPLKMFRPLLSAWMKQCRQLTGGGVQRICLSPFELVAAITSRRQIIRFIPAAQRARQNVINDQRHPHTAPGGLAILATMIGGGKNLLPNRLANHEFTAEAVRLMAEWVGRANGGRPRRMLYAASANLLVGAIGLIRPVRHRLTSPAPAVPGDAPARLAQLARGQFAGVGQWAAIARLIIPLVFLAARYLQSGVSCRLRFAPPAFQWVGAFVAPAALKNGITTLVM